MTPQTSTNPTPIRDGRILRGERSRGAIVDALFDLIGRGDYQPTAEEVATLAGVKVRTVFRHFADMASLNSEISSRLREQVTPLFMKVIRDGTLAERADSLVSSRCNVFEQIAPYKRAGDSLRWRFEFLQKENDRFTRELRDHLLATFPELDSAPPETVATLELLTSFESWNRLRTAQRLSADRVRVTIRHAVLGALDRL